MGDLKYNVHALQCKGLFWVGGVVGGIRSKRPTSVFDRGPSLATVRNIICINLPKQPFNYCFVLCGVCLWSCVPLGPRFRWLPGI